MKAALWWIGVPLGLALGAILTTPIAPMVDWGEHLAISHMLGNLGQWPPHLAEEFCKSRFFPYHVFHYLAAGLLSIVGPTWISRVMLAFLLLWFALGVYLMLRAFRADTRGVALALPLFFGFIYQMGFGPNLLGLPFVFVSLAQAERYRLDPRKAQGVLLTLVLLACWLVHAMPFYLSMCCLALFFFCHHVRSPWRLVQAALWMLVPALISVAYIMWIATNINPTFASSFQEPGLLQKLWQVSDILFGIERARGGWLSWFYLACLLALIVNAWVATNPEDRAERFHIARLTVLCVLLCFFLLTSHFLMGVHYVFQRFLQPFVLVLLCLIPVLRDRRSQWLFFAGYGVCLVLLGVNWHAHWKWEKEVAGFRKIAAQIPSGTRLVVLAPPLKHRLLKRHVLSKLGHTLVPHRNMRVSPSLTFYQMMPVHDCYPERQKPIVSAGIENAPWRFRPALHRRFATHLLIYSTSNPALDQRIYGWLFQPGSAQYKPVTRIGRWLLLRTIVSGDPGSRRR